tara:strand:+ start:1645 stop:3099 length:1455 start_codon:yes stop_codon:yes gene_type:complete
MDTGQSTQLDAPPPTKTNETPQPDFAPPDFLRLQQIPVNYIQQVETDLLEPVVFTQGSATSDGFARFTLQNKGFLHSHSKVFLAIEPTNASQDTCFFAPHIGVAQLVKKAVLKIGNKTLNELDSWGGLHAIKSSMISNENSLERELYTTGRCMANKFEYNSGDSRLAGSIGLDAGVEPKGADTKLPEWAISDVNSLNECPSFSIDLSDLFPFLKLHQLPLYMINEPINIELTFHPTAQLRCQVAGADPSVDQPINIVRDQLKFCADYIFYGASDEMARYASANKDLNFSFVDYRLIEHSTTHTELGSGLIQNLGMANRIVPRVLSMISPDDADNNEATILGQYQGIAPNVNASGVAGAIKYNVRYNDRYEYTSDVENTARLFSLLTDTEGVPYLNRQLYAEQGIAGGYTTGTFETRAQDTNLPGRFFYLGSRLTNGRVGQRGIELHVSGDWVSAGVKTPNLLRSYCEYVRVARLVNGMMEIYNA